MGKQVVARLNGGVAQLGEHLPCKQGVKSSNLSVSIESEMILKRMKYSLILRGSKPMVCRSLAYCQCLLKRICEESKILL